MKTWEKPQLIILTRSHIPEAVLVLCKDWEGGTTPQYVFDGCMSLSDGFCWECNAADIS